MEEITYEDLRNPQADTVGEYEQHVRAAAEIINLAHQSGVIDEVAVQDYVRQFQDADNASEVFKVRRPLLTELYHKAIDYSDILVKHKLISKVNGARLSHVITKMRP